VKIRGKLLIAALLIVAAPVLVQAQGSCLRENLCARMLPQAGFCEMPMLMALAEEGSPDQPTEGEGPGHGHGRGDFEQRRKYLEQLRLLKLLETLNLTEEQETKFVASFRVLRRDLHGLERERAAILMELSAAVEKEQVTAATVDQYTGKLKDMELRRRERGQQFLSDMKPVLSPEQLAKFILFQERFELELLERVREFRGRMGTGQSTPDDSGH